VRSWRTKPSQAAYAAALLNRLGEVYEITQKAEAQTALLSDFFVQFGHDSHSELMVDMMDLNLADVVNSWGDWEDGGFHQNGFPFDRINYAYGCFAFRCTQ
jgi:hypothetical protein